MYGVYYRQENRKGGYQIRGVPSVSLKKKFIIPVSTVMTRVRGVHLSVK